MSAPHTEIRYPFAEHPTGATAIEVAPGIQWLRLPLPFRLNHVNIWLLREADGFTVIDTGADTAQARELWPAIEAGVMGGGKVRRLIATHGHTDHIGLSGWLTRRWDCTFSATMAEYFHAQVRHYEARFPVPVEDERWLASHGCAAETIMSYVKERERNRAQLGAPPPAYQRLRDGETIRIGGRDWTIIACGGHAIEHASFYCAADKLLIAGDQVLSKISPMIGVFPAEPLSDPLSDYLSSFERFRRLPADTYVLPSHGLPFYGLHARVEQLADHHRQRLATLVELMARPTGSMVLTGGLFARAVAEGQGRMALAETLAHAHHLIATGRARRTLGDAGEVLFART